MNVRSSSNSNSKDFGIFSNTNTTTTTTTNGTQTTNSNNNLMTAHNNNNNGPPHPSSCSSSYFPSYMNGGSSNDVEEDEEDEYCVYTYKGDPSSSNAGLPPGADLPSSFLNFDQGDGTSSGGPYTVSATTTNDEHPALPSGSASSICYRLQNGLDTHTTNGTLHHTNPNGSVVTISGNPVINGLIGVSGNVYSPDMDFLEMDFDPGVPDEDDDETPGTKGEDAMNHLLQTLSTSDHKSQSPNGNSTSSVSVLSNSINGDVTDGCIPGPSSSAAATTSSVRPLDASTSSNSSPSKKACIKYEMTSNEGIVVESISASPDSSDELEVALNQTAQKPCCSKSLSLNTSNSNLLHGCSISSPLVGNSPKEIKTIRTNNSISATLSASVSNISSPFLLSSPKREQVIPTVKLVKSNTLPEICAHSATAAEDVQRAKISFSIPLIKKVIRNLEEAFDTDDDSVEVNVESVMIWSMERAQIQSVNQIGQSACGATAVCNVLMALGYEAVSSEIVERHVQTRLRKNDAEIPEYLFSRSVAGATHVDLINAVVQITSGEIDGRMFHPSSGVLPEVFSNWLFKWICKGAIPVATRNLQILVNRERDYASDEGEEIPDSWHHQMIFGTTSGGQIFLTNPIEYVKADKLLPQLVTDSVLLIRRQDIISRKTPHTDFRRLGNHADPRWKEMNVLGQVANIFLEGELVFNGTSVARRVRTSHIEIPAAYVGGITLFMKTDSPYYEELQNCTEI